MNIENFFFKFYIIIITYCYYQEKEGKAIDPNIEIFINKGNNIFIQFFQIVVFDANMGNLLFR
jgi:aspartate 1-decarboxylase